MPSGAIYSFGRFELDGRTRQLRRDGERVALSDRYLSVLLHLAAHAGNVVSKDDLVKAGWGDTAVGDNSLEQAISALRRALSTGDSEYVETVPRQGYRFTAPVARATPQASAADIDALLAPHRALVDGRAALESLERDQIRRGRDVFTQIVALTPDAAPAHVGLANACVLQFEMTRADDTPDTEALKLAAHHAYEACRLDTQHAEAWSTLSFILERTGTHADAIAAARRAILLEPDNWRHQFRLASIAWGEERLRAARRTLALLPGFALAHWLAASVLVARNMLDEAERDLDAGIPSTDNSLPRRSGAGAEAGLPRRSGEFAEASQRFSGVALHWLRGLVHLARDDESLAMADLEQELASEASGHLYARECCANAWYAIGVLHLRHHRRPEAHDAFERALLRVPKHPLARFGRAIARGEPATAPGNAAPQSMDEVFCVAAGQVRAGSHAAAARLIEQALSMAPPSNAGWLLPVEPLLNVSAAPDEWKAALGRLAARTM